MKNVLVGLGLLVSGTVLADGFYAGGQLGLDMTKLERKFHQPTIYHDYNDNSNKSSMDGGIYLGYNMSLTDKFKIAVEADIFLGSQKHNNTNMMFDDLFGTTYRYGVKGKTGYSYNLSVLGAYVINDMFDVYGRLGISQTSIKMDLMYNPQVADITMGKNKTRNPLGLVVGLGAEMKLDTIHENLENMSVRADYRYIHYQKKTQRLYGWPGKLKYNLNKHMVMVGVHYQF